MHLGSHEFAGGHDDILALLAGKVTVDIPGIFEQVCGITLQKLHLLQRLLKLLSFLDHLERTQQKIYSVKIEFSSADTLLEQQGKDAVLVYLILRTAHKS